MRYPGWTCAVALATGLPATSAIAQVVDFSKYPDFRGQWDRNGPPNNWVETSAGEEPSEVLAARTTRLKEKLAKLEEEVKRLKAIEKQMLAAPDQQISFTDPDSRSMATSGRGSGMVGYNVQTAVDTTNHLIVAHEVTNVGTDNTSDRVEFLHRNGR
jgi:hypothetical protein